MTTSDEPRTSDTPAPGPASAVGTLGGVVTLLAAAALVVAAFLPWTADGWVAVDIPVLGGGSRRVPSIGLVLIALAALPALAVLVSRRGWARLAAGVGAGVTALAWVAGGPEGALTEGLWVALGGAAALLVGAALAD